MRLGLKRTVVAVVLGTVLASSGPGFASAQALERWFSDEAGRIIEQPSPEPLPRLKPSEGGGLRLTRAQLWSLGKIGDTAVYGDLSDMFQADISAMPSFTGNVDLFALMNDGFDLDALPASQRMLIRRADQVYAEQCGPGVASHAVGFRPIPLPHPLNSVSEHEYVCAVLYNAALMKSKMVAKQIKKRMVGVVVRQVIVGSTILSNAARSTH